jgi:hypothetical protein
MSGRTGEPRPDDRDLAEPAGSTRADERDGADPAPTREAGLSATSGDADPPGGTTQATDARPPESVRHAEDGAGVGEGRQE